MSIEEKSFLESIKQDGAPAFEPDAKETTTPSEPQTEKKEEPEKPSQEGGNTPDEETSARENKRWAEMRRENRELKEQLAKEQLAKKNSEPSAPVKPSPAPSTELPEHWRETYGDTPESRTAYAKWQAHERELIAQAKKEFIEDQKREKEEQEQEVKKWSDFIEDQVDLLRSKGLKFERNKLLKVVQDYSPRNEKGNFSALIDFNKAYEILQFQEMKEKPPEKDAARKEIAAKTSSDNKGGSAEKVGMVGSKGKVNWFGWQDKS